jgi:hypothetical protein
MKNLDVHRRAARLDALFAKASFLPTEGEFRAHWALYLCVLASGMIEKSVARLLSDYAKGKGHERLTTFVESRVRRLQNANVKKILDQLRDFGPDWVDAFELRIDDDIRDAVDSIVANRHQIAHGNDTGMSLATISDYWRRAKVFLEALEAHVET